MVIYLEMIFKVTNIFGLQKFWIKDDRFGTCWIPDHNNKDLAMMCAIWISSDHNNKDLAMMCAIWISWAAHTFMQDRWLSLG